MDDKNVARLYHAQAIRVACVVTSGQLATASCSLPTVQNPHAQLPPGSCDCASCPLAPLQDARRDLQGIIRRTVPRNSYCNPRPVT